MSLFSPAAGQDTIYFERNGKRSDFYKCNFSSSKLTLLYKKLDVTEGDKVVRVLHDKEVLYTVQEVAYSAGQLTGMPHYTLNLIKDAALPKSQPSTTTNHININGSKDIQFGDHNVQNLQVALKEVVAAIDKAGASREEQDAAKSLLTAFLAHPLVNTVVGAGLSTSLGLMVK